MIPIFVVSMPNSARRLSMTSKLKDMEFEYLDAIVGKFFLNEIDQINNTEWVKNRYKRNLTAGEFGCSESHKKIYKKIIELKIPWVIILEDDVDFSINFQKIINNNIEDFNPENIYIFGCQEGLDSSRYIVLSENKNLDLGEIKFRKCLSSDRYIYRTAAYLISSKVAENIISFTKNKYCLADDWDVFHKENIYKSIYLSNFVSHPEDLNNQSTIEKDRSLNSNLSFNKFNNVQEFLKKIKTFTRKIIIRRFYD